MVSPGPKPNSPTVIAAHRRDQHDLELVTAATPDETLARARSAIEDGRSIYVAPDHLFENDGEIDRDLWLAFASTLIVDGVSALETTLVRDARRLFATHAAILAGAIVPDRKR